MAFNVQHNSITYTSNLTIPLIANTGAVYITANGNNFVYDANGNFGLGITPSGWNSAYKTFEFGVSGNNYGAVWSSSNTDGGSSAYGQVGIGQNISAGTKYVGLGASSYYLQSGGRHEWYTSSYGSAGSNISFSQVMTLTSNGQLLLGSTSPVKSYSVLSITHLGGSQDAIDIMNTNQVGNGTALAMFNGSGTGIGSITMSQTGITVTSASSLLLGSNNTVAMTLDASGNLGLGVTPSAWASSVKALELPTGAFYSYASGSVSNFYTLTNAYLNGSGNPIYKQSSYATQYLTTAGQHQWFTAPSGTAGNAISFTQAMTLTNNGNLGIGTTSPTYISGYGNITINGSTGSLVDVSSNGTIGGRIQCDTTYPGMALFAITNNPMVFGTNSTERMRLDTNGNLGLGVTPSAWSSAFKALQIGTSGVNSILNMSAPAGAMVFNSYYNGTNYLYQNSSYAGRFDFNYSASGGFAWNLASSGTAGGTASFTQAMTLTNSGQLMVGTTTALGSAGTFYGSTATVILSQGSSSSYAGLRIYNDINSSFRSLEIDYYGSAVSGGERAEITTTGAYPLCFLTTNTERARIDSSGNLGIGTSSPTQKLQVVGNIASSGNGCLLALNSTSDGIYIVGGNKSYNAFSVGDYGIGSVGAMKFASNNNINMTLDSSGNLGLGVTPSAWSSSDKAIQVGTNSCFYNQGSTYTMVSHNGYNSSGSDIYLTTNYATRYYQGGGTHYWSVAPSGTAGNTISWTLAMTLDNNSNLTCAGNITAYGSLSDRKLKENIQPLTRGLNTLLKLNPVSFDWKKETKENEMVGITHDFGLIAQEVQEVIPELVRADREGTLSIRDRGLVSILIKAIQELKAEVDSLKEQIAVG